MRISNARQMGFAVASARRECGLTQGDLARKAGISRQLENRLEAGEAEGISLGRLLAVLDSLGYVMSVDPLAQDSAQEAGLPTATNLLAEIHRGVGQLDQSLFDTSDSSEAREAMPL